MGEEFQMTDTSPAAVVKPFSLDWAAYASDFDDETQLVLYSDYAALFAQLAAANAELARISRDNEFEAWAGKCQRECDAANQRNDAYRHESYRLVGFLKKAEAQLDAANQRADAAYAKGKADGLREAANIAYVECAKTRHVMLSIAASDALLAIAGGRDE